MLNSLHCTGDKFRNGRLMPRERSAGVDLQNRSRRCRKELCKTERTVRFEKTDQVVRDRVQNFFRRPGGADLHPAIEETRVGIDDLTFETFGDQNCGIALA